jgi:tetratricopeptide (TPR) repeat protein
MFGNLFKGLLRKAPEEVTAQVSSLYERGASAWQAERYAEAARCAEQAISLDATLAAVHFMLGSARLELGDFKAAQTAFAACQALSPGYPLVLHAEMRRAQARARADLASGRVPRALQGVSAEARSISIIMCSIKPERFAKISANYHALLAAVPHEIIGIHDARSLAEGYNRGIRQASGEVLVFSHDDIEIVAPDFAAKLLALLTRYDLVGVAGTTRLIGPSWIYAGWPHIHGQVAHVHAGLSGTGRITVTAYGPATANAQAMDGVFLAVRREVFERVGFDESTFDGWHLYDIDFTYSAYLAGCRAAICHDLCLIHDSSGRFGEDWQHYAQRFVDKHRDRLPLARGLAFPELCLIEVNSSAEWLLMTEEMTSQLYG